MPPSKRDVFEHLLLNGPVWIQLDARPYEVEVPEKHKSDPYLVLMLGYGLEPPVYNFLPTDRGILANVKFDGKRKDCFVPWSAIYEMRGEEGLGMKWQEDRPRARFVPYLRLV